MKKIFFSGKELARIRKYELELEKALEIKLHITKDSITLESSKNDSFVEHISSFVLDALALGFDFETAIQLKDPNYILKKIDIKNRVKDNRVNVVIGRIIGTKGKTKHLIEKLSEADIVISEHTIAILGNIDNVEIANHAIEALIRGSPQSKVYGVLEKSRARLKELGEQNIEDYIEKEEKTTKK